MPPGVVSRAFPPSNLVARNQTPNSWAGGVVQEGKPALAAEEALL